MFQALCQLPKFAHDTHNLTSVLPLRKLPIILAQDGKGEGVDKEVSADSRPKEIIL